MTAIQFVNRDGAARFGPRAQVLARAATDALKAPSIFNSQPWRWRISDDTAELRADRARQLTAVDPDGRLLTVSCGAALHHARTALAAAGYRGQVAYLPDGDDGDLLAAVRLVDPIKPDPETLRRYRAMSLRRTDRRPFADRPVPPAALHRLRAAAQAHGAHLQFPDQDGLISLAVAASQAATRELSNPAYRTELASWVDRARGAGAQDGVPAATAAPKGARPVPIRDFTATGPDQIAIHDRLDLADRSARYAVLSTDGDTPRDWLAAGEALSAVLLAAVLDGLATSPMSDLVEVPTSRASLRRLLAGIGYPAMVIRIGVAATATAPPATPRRGADDAVEVLEVTTQQSGG